MKRGEDREKLKDKLAKAMSYEINGDSNNTTPPPVRLPKPEPKMPTKKDIWHDRMLYVFNSSIVFYFTVTLIFVEFYGKLLRFFYIVVISQIRERAEWIAEMEDLGHAAPHREIIREQIAERVRALDALGVESECSSVRSGFSTLRSREVVGDTASSKGSAKSGKSAKSKTTSAKSGKMSLLLS